MSAIQRRRSLRARLIAVQSGWAEDSTRASTPSLIRLLFKSVQGALSTIDSLSNLVEIMAIIARWWWWWW